MYIWSQVIIHMHSFQNYESFATILMTINKTDLNFLWLSFTACGPSYELKSYPQHKQLNSQVVEQANSRLQRIKSQLSYMTHKNFIQHCKFYLWDQNRNVVAKLWLYACEKCGWTASKRDNLYQHICNL